MDRRTVIIGAGAALALAGCAGATAMEPQAPYDADRIEVRAEGRGPDVILIPGLSSQPGIWDALTERLSLSHRVHRVHVRGFAGLDTGANASGLVAAPVAQAIADYITDNGLSRPAVIGHSMGGTIGLMLAARHPAQVGRLMVVDQLPFMGMLFGPPGSTPDSVRAVADATRDRMASSTDAAWAAGASASLSQMIRTEAARPGPIRDAATTDRDVAARSMHELIVTDLRPELAAITAPTTVLYVRGPNIPLSDAQMDAVYQASYANLSGVTLKRIPDAWHFIMLDQPAAFAAEVDAFLGG